MNKRIIVLIILLLGITVITGGLIVQSLVTSNNSQEQTELTEPITNLEPSSKTKKYRDASGFSFEYPEVVIVEKLEATDESIYSQLKLTAEGDGSIVLTVQDTEFETFEDFKKEQSNAVSNERAITLGSLEGNEMQEGTITRTIVIDQGILFSLDMDAKDSNEYWEKVYEKIKSSFAFTAPESTTSSDSTSQSSGASTEEVIFEEEIIE